MTRITSCATPTNCASMKQLPSSWSGSSSRMRQPYPRRDLDRDHTRPSLELGAALEPEIASMKVLIMRAYKNYSWIVCDPALLGGKLAVRGTRLSVALILECLS